MDARSTAQGAKALLKRPIRHPTLSYMKRLIILPLFALAACETPVVEPVPTGVSPVPRPEQVTVKAPPPPPSARTVEQFDTTSAEDRAEALKVEEPAGEKLLGTTNVSLGSPADPGIWLKTPLVTALSEGRAEYPANGKTVNIELRPSGGEAGSASQMSLAAMRLLGIPLTALADIKVYR